MQQDLYEDRVRKLIKYKEVIVNLMITTSEDEEYTEIYNDIVKQYLEDFIETIDFHIEDSREALIEAQETGEEDNDFIIVEDE